MATTFELSDEELELINRWYYSAAGESMSGTGGKAKNDRVRDLLEKLGIEPHDADKYEFDHEN